jgi:hypothetical protein
MYKELEKLCKVETKEMIKSGEYIYMDNNSDILGVAHLDTVFDLDKKNNFYFESENYIFSPKLDDRAGAFALLYYIPKHFKHIKYDILLTTDEEIGRSTAGLFKTEKQYKWIFEFDRQGTGAVMYNYELIYNWAETVSRNFKLHHGSYSDICMLDELNACALNIGTGYHNQHTISCYLNKKEFEKQIRRFADFYSVNKNNYFPYYNDYEFVEDEKEYIDNYFMDSFYNDKYCDLENIV